MSDTAPAIPKSWNAKKTPLQLAHGLLSKLGCATRFLAPLLTRLVIGYAFYQTGSGKLGKLDDITKFFEGLGIPFPRANAIFIACLECYGGIALMLGVGTRLVASLLGATMVVALMTADKAAFLAALPWTEDKGLTDVVPIMYGMLLLWLLLYGPGILSIDALIKWAMKKAGLIVDTN